MVHQKILNLLNEVSDSKFVRRHGELPIINQTRSYDVENEIIYNTEVWKSNLCVYFSFRIKMWMIFLNS